MSGSEALDEAQGLVREADELTYTVVHDVKGQLQGMVGLASLLADVEGARLSADGQDWCERIQATGEKLAAMLDALLRLLRVDRGELVREPVDLTMMAAEIAATLEFERDLPRVVVTVDPEMPTVQASPTLLGQALTHLLRNVAQHGGPEPRARVTYDRATDEIVVSDDGPGLADAAERCFEPFYKRPESPGPGIGLTFARRVARRHGGEARIDAGVGGGSGAGLTVRLRVVPL